MGEFGRRRVERELAWEYSVENLLAAYQRALSKKTSINQRVLSERRVFSKPALPIEPDEIEVNDSIVNIIGAQKVMFSVNLSGPLSEPERLFRLRDRHDMLWKVRWRSSVSVSGRNPA